MVVLLSTYPALVSWPPALRRLVDLVVLSAPLVAAVIVAGRLAADGIARATGIRRWRWTDAALGVLVALVVRAIVELVSPTTGSLFGPLETTPDTTATVVLVIGLVLVTPLVEELFFRGLVLRATQDALGRGTTAIRRRAARLGRGLHRVARHPVRTIGAGGPARQHPRSGPRLRHPDHRHRTSRRRDRRARRLQCDRGRAPPLLTPGAHESAMRESPAPWQGR